jgi:hypothetical protein
MKILLISLRHWTVVLIAILLCAQAMMPAMAFDDFRQQQPVSEAVLDRMRGGFQIDPNGPVMSFGIQRSVYLNGRLVNSTILTIPDVLQLTNNASNAFTLIQNGAGNAMTTHPSSLPPLMTVIQNSLDHQTIQNQTVINATVAALSLNRALALGNAVSQANLNAIHH